MSEMHFFIQMKTIYIVISTITILTLMLRVPDGGYSRQYLHWC